eukprot:702508-Rhodomonas_salina.2
MSGIDTRHTTISSCLCRFYGMPGNDLAYGATSGGDGRSSDFSGFHRRSSGGGWKCSGQSALFDRPKSKAKSRLFVVQVVPVMRFLVFDFAPTRILSLLQLIPRIFILPRALIPTAVVRMSLYCTRTTGTDNALTHALVPGSNLCGSRVKPLLGGQRRSDRGFDRQV